MIAHHSAEDAGNVGDEEQQVSLMRLLDQPPSAGLGGYAVCFKGGDPVGVLDVCTFGLYDGKSRKGPEKNAVRWLSLTCSS